MAPELGWLEKLLLQGGALCCCCCGEDTLLQDDDGNPHDAGSEEILTSPGKKVQQGIPLQAFRHSQGKQVKFDFDSTAPQPAGPDEGKATQQNKLPVPSEAVLKEVLKEDPQERDPVVDKKHLDEAVNFFKQVEEAVRVDVRDAKRMQMQIHPSTATGTSGVSRK
eukprot:TRINITY_DN8183_c0_g1_i1.p1 TRINITY_DN8183_c0_g1~~TRINITY_DN8183_c0_g1_i1.p1  ORF type:complete len:165 (+),score=47.45 TRINITY_DN8183_c0_g1_i1:125-619(+)